MGNGIGGRTRYQLSLTSLTQRELAQKIGVTEAAMSRYISGKRIPKGNTLAAIAGALETSTDYLLGTCGEETEHGYDTVRKWIIFHSGGMSTKQKLDLVKCLFDPEEAVSTTHARNKFRTGLGKE